MKTLNTLNPIQCKPTITHFDAGRLRLLMTAGMAERCRTATWLNRLDHLLKQAQIVPAEEIRPDTVTMNSRIRLRDKSDCQTMDLTLVFPNGASAIGGEDEQYRVSILSPMGLSVLGRRVGHEIHGRLAIEQIMYQPEAAGEYDLC
jgi:regulator of nucleoside diphosphate kinase